MCVGNAASLGILGTGEIFLDVIWGIGEVNNLHSVPRRIRQQRAAHGMQQQGSLFCNSRLSWHQTDQQSQGQGMIPIGYQGFREGGAGPAQVFRGAICAIGVYFPLRFAGWQQKAQECSCKCARTVCQKRVRICRCTRVVYTRRVLQSPTPPVLVVVEYESSVGVGVGVDGSATVSIDSSNPYLFLCFSF